MNKNKFKPKGSNKEYESLQNYSDMRTKELTPMMQPFIKITDRYGRLISRLTLILGDIKPTDIQDVVVRDLMADVFDSLYEARILILAGKLNVAFPVARRAYESLSLLHICTLDKSWAEKWSKGKKIGNVEVRKELDKHPMGEKEENTKKYYDFFCLATHPNRATIPTRFLGEGNQFVLGVIGQPNLVLVVDYCQKTLEMWFWFTATVTFFYKDVFSNIDKNYMEAYMQTANDAKDTATWLIANLNKLIKEAQEFWEKENIDK